MQGSNSTKFQRIIGSLGWSSFTSSGKPFVPFPVLLPKQHKKTCSFSQCFFTQQGRKIQLCDPASEPPAPLPSAETSLVSLRCLLELWAARRVSHRAQCCAMEGLQTIWGQRGWLWCTDADLAFPAPCGTGSLWDDRFLHAVGTPSHNTSRGDLLQKKAELHGRKKQWPCPEHYSLLPLKNRFINTSTCQDGSGTVSEVAAVSEWAVFEQSI